MRVKLFSSVIVFLIFGCSDYNKTQNVSLLQFNEFLGEEKALVFDRLVDSFVSFLSINFPNEKNIGEKTKVFLKSIEQGDTLVINSWKFNLEELHSLFDDFESSGLRKEIYLYYQEDYKAKNHDYWWYLYDPFDFSQTNSDDDSSALHEVEELKSIDFIIDTNASEILPERRETERKFNSYSFNLSGKFLYGLAKFSPADSAIESYVDAKIQVGYISRRLTASGLLHDFSYRGFDNPFLHRIIVAEMYLFMVKNKLNR